MNVIIILLILFTIIVLFFNYKNKNNEQFNNIYPINDLNIDNTFILKRPKEYTNYISNLIDDKKYIFSDDQIKILKNNTQFYDVTDPDNIKNISDKIYNMSNNLDNQTELISDSVNNDNLIEDSNLEYENIINNLQKNINNNIEPNCVNTAILNNSKYLKNYYMDIYGNNINSDLSDYFTDYYTNINSSNPNKHKNIPVETIKGKSNFIIPDQYNTQKLLTNAYNIDWSRIINPHTIV